METKARSRSRTSEVAAYRDPTLGAVRVGSEVAPSLSVVIPAFNEEAGIASSIVEIRQELESSGIDAEIIVVDDGSTDETAKIAGEEGVSVISLPENRGYGAALKAGIAGATHDLLVITDADGTYPAEAIPDLFALAADYDMVVGARTKGKVAVPTLRKPAKWFLGWLASYLAGRKIPDLNSGLRVVRRSLVERFLHVLPSGFSFTTSITLAALCSDALVYYHPIEYRARLGESKIRPIHAFDFLLLIVRTIVYFNPLRVFLPLGALLFLAALGKLIYDIIIGNLSESAVMGFLAAVILWAVGLISDQIARMGAKTWLR